MSNGDAIIAGEGPYVLLASNPECYLQHRGDGTVWCKWSDGQFVEVVPKSQIEYLHDIIRAFESAAHDSRDNSDRAAGFLQEITRLRQALEQIESCPDDSNVLRNIARDALRFRTVETNK